MNKLKNIGISALAGTLVSLSAAQAGGVSVTGSWELSYTNLNHEKTSGNKFGMNKNLGFGASGDVSDGGGVTWGTTLTMSDAAGLSSASMNLNMGGIATLAYDSGTGSYGANAVDNIVPTAWEEIDYGFSTGITDVGDVSKSKGVINLSVTAPGGSGVSLSYVSRMGGGHVGDGGASDADTGAGRGLDARVDIINVNQAHFGIRWGLAAQTEIIEANCKGTMVNNETDCKATYKDNPFAGTSYMTLQLGPLHLGTQATFKELMLSSQTAVKNKRSIVAGAALIFGDTVSISYGEAWDRYRWNDANRGFDDSVRQLPVQAIQSGASGDGIGGGSDYRGPDANEYTTTKFRGWSAAINMGPVALKGTRNNVDGVGENGSSSPRSHSEVNLSIAF